MEAREDLAQVRPEKLGTAHSGVRKIHRTDIQTCNWKPETRQQERKEKNEEVEEDFSLCDGNGNGPWDVGDNICDIE